MLFYVEVAFYKKFTGFNLHVLQMKFWLAAIVVLCVTWTSEGETQPARLLASKNVLNQYLVEGRDLTVQYNIFNIGGR